jgi:hypothetical protein
MCITYVKCVFVVLPACNAHAPLCHPSPAQLYNIFSHSHKRHDFLKNVNDNKVHVLFSLLHLKHVSFEE